MGRSEKRKSIKKNKKDIKKCMSEEQFKIFMGENTKQYIQSEVEARVKFEHSKIVNSFVAAMQKNKIPVSKIKAIASDFEVILLRGISNE